MSFINFIDTGMEDNSKSKILSKENNVTTFVERGVTPKIVNIILNQIRE
jgi:hypothetical protein